MPKLERSRPDLRKPCYPRPAGVPESKEHGSRSHPDNARARRVGRASASWRIFRTSKTTRHLGRRGPGVYRSQLVPFTACRHTRRQGGPRQQSHVIVAHRDECAPRPSWSFLICVHRFQKGCCQTCIIFCLEFFLQRNSDCKFNRYSADPVFSYYRITITGPVKN